MRTPSAAIQSTVTRCVHTIPATIWLDSIIERNMKFILLISNAFINTMGITQPSPQAANRAAWFIVTHAFLVVTGRRDHRNYRHPLGSLLTEFTLLLQPALPLEKGCFTVYRMAYDCGGWLHYQLEHAINDPIRYRTFRKISALS